MPFVEDVVEGHHLRTDVLHCINVLLNGYEPNTKRRILDLQVLANVKIVTPETAEVFDDNRVYLTVFDHSLHTLKIGAVEGRTRNSVIYEKLRMVKTIGTSVLG